ncbi:hypothetical protein ACWIID_34330 [Streptomyces phaeochromogenes]
MAGIAARLSAFAVPGQVRAAVCEDAPLFASQADPAVGPSIRQGVGPSVPAVAQVAPTAVEHR